MENSTVDYAAQILSLQSERDKAEAYSHVAKLVHERIRHAKALIEESLVDFDFWCERLEPLTPDQAKFLKDTSRRDKAILDRLYT